jgi:hypothetical protein
MQHKQKSLPRWLKNRDECKELFQRYKIVTKESEPIDDDEKDDNSDSKAELVSEV